MDSIKLICLGILKFTFNVLVPLLFINFGIYQEYYPLFSKAMDILYIIIRSDDIKVTPFSKKKSRGIVIMIMMNK